MTRSETTEDRFTSDEAHPSVPPSALYRAGGPKVARRIVQAGVMFVIRRNDANCAHLETRL